MKNHRDICRVIGIIVDCWATKNGCSRITHGFETNTYWESGFKVRTGVSDFLIYFASSFSGSDENLETNFFSVSVKILSTKSSTSIFYLSKF